MQKSDKQIADDLRTHFTVLLDYDGRHVIPLDEVIKIIKRKELNDTIQELKN